MYSKAIRSSKGDKFFMFLIYLFIAIALLLVIYPLIYVISASISSPTSVNSGEMWLLPKKITWDGYKTIFTYKSMARLPEHDLLHITRNIYQFIMYTSLCICSRKSRILWEKSIYEVFDGSYVYQWRFGTYLFID